MAERPAGRVECLDYLRGLMALTVMVYHYVSWSGHALDASSLLGRMGIYAVSVFYVLSGLSLAIVYSNRIRTRGDVSRFIARRIFRIFPLFWVVTSAALVLNHLSADAASFDAYRAFLNYSLLFGFVEPTAYLSVGGWSIGNEVVFYAIIAAVFLLSSRSSWSVPATMGLSAAIGIYFAFGLLVPGKPLTEQWALYVNPLNQFFLFMGGVMIGAYARASATERGRARYLVATLGCVLLFWFYPVDGDQINIVVGIDRIVFGTLTIAFVLFVYLWQPVVNLLPARVLSFFGESCYSIYLLHPLVAIVVTVAIDRLGFGRPAGAYAVAAVITLLASWLTYRLVEAPMMRLGKNLTTGMTVVSLSSAASTGRPADLRGR